MFIPVGDYRPDAGDFGGHDENADGVFPMSTGYVTAPPLVALTTPDIATKCVGGFSARSHNGTDRNFFAGTSNLFTFTSATSTNVSKSAGAYSTPTFWEFTRFGNHVLGVNGAQSATDGDPIQQFELDSATTFTDVTGAPNAAHIGTIKDFVVVGNTWDATDNFQRSRVRWCAVGDHTSWTVSATTQADFNDLPFGTVQRIVGGEYGLVITESSVWRMSYVGSPLVFQFDEVLPGIGTESPASVVRADNYVFMWATDGFRAIINGAETKAIGKERVDRTAKANFTVPSLVFGAVDPRATRVYWMNSNQGGLVLCYDWTLDRWSQMNATSTFSSIEYFFPTRGIESTNSEEITVSRGTGSKGDLHSFGAYSGSTRQPVTIRSAFKELTPGQYSTVTRVLPVVGKSSFGGTSVGINIYSRKDMGKIAADEATYTETLHEGTAAFTLRSHGRYHAFEFSLNGSHTTAHEYQGFDWEGAPRGKR